LTEGKVWLSVNSWLTRTKPSRYAVSVSDSEITGLLAETKVDEKCGANRKSRVAKITTVFLLNHVNFTANTQFEFLNCL
jgi:hypothetical protein